MQAHEAVVRHAFYWFATGVILVNLPVSVADSLAQPGVYRPGFVPAVLGVIACLVTVALWKCATGRSAALPLKATVLVSVVALAAHPWAVVRPVPYPPLLHVLGAGMVISALVGVRASLAIVPVFATGVALLRAPMIGLGPAVTEALLLAVSGLLGTACLEIFQRAGRSVLDAVERSWALLEQNARVSNRAQERERWDGLIHDKVLGALRLAGGAPDRSVPPAASELAAQALAELRGEAFATLGSSVEQWRVHAAQVGLDARIDVTGEIVPLEVREAVVGAVNEALTNVSRHSGQRSVSVVGYLGDARAQLVVADPGSGFSPSRTPHRAGLRTSIMGRMRAIGGRAQINSAPGAGTRVTLTWDARGSASPDTAVQWQLRSVIPMEVLGWSAVVLAVVVSREQWGAAPLAWLATAGIAAIAAITAAAMLLSPTRRSLIGLALTTWTTIGAMALNTAPQAGTDWRYWYLSALTPAIAAMSFRFRRWAGVSIGVAAVALVTAVDGWAGRHAWESLTGPVPVLLAAAVGAQLIRGALARAWTAVENASREAAELRLTIAAETERSREAGMRVAALEGAAGPALELLTRSRTLTVDQATDLRLLEAAVRDQLAAPALLDAATIDALRMARARGVVVDIVAIGAGDGHTDDDEVCALWRAALGALLGSAARGTRVRVTWVGDEVPRTTMSAVGVGLKPVIDATVAVIRTSPGGPSLVIGHDEEALLVEHRLSARHH